MRVLLGSKNPRKVDLSGFALYATEVHGKVYEYSASTYSTNNSIDIEAKKRCLSFSNFQ